MKCHIFIHNACHMEDIILLNVDRKVCAVCFFFFFFFFFAHSAPTASAYHTAVSSFIRLLHPIFHISSPSAFIPSQFAFTSISPLPSLRCFIESLELSVSIPSLRLLSFFVPFAHFCRMAATYPLSIFKIYNCSVCKYPTSHSKTGRKGAWSNYTASYGLRMW